MATARPSSAVPGRTGHPGAMREPPTPPSDPIPEGLAERAALLGGTEGILTDEQIREFVAGQLASTEVDGKSVCLIIPDGTRSVPLPKVLPAIHDALAGRASSVTVLIALGTHAQIGRAHV